ncbi:hypothetical protein OPU71_14605 [Niveibacterium sp. 24ML]|uniref:hypothetical protein n=1 Tax=Niveibacterium sp. 24ML TaxID=2985512 RepID=UPI002270A154|nr:hypothetical protein [Niveibacterium sp. 24ML]MCX9157357.1 hypothetical protein [Niveibacterium sp. 24ML]
MSARRYAIADEPLPGAAARFIVNPIWPVLATMIVGGLPGLAWLALNGFALGSPTRVREAVLCAAGIALAFAVLWGTHLAHEAGWLSTQLARYVLLLALVSKLACAYRACFMQQRAIELYQYYGGRVANGLIPLLVGAFFLAPVLSRGVTTPWLRNLVLS